MKKHITLSILLALLTLTTAAQQSGIGLKSNRDTLQTYFRNWLLGADNLPHIMPEDTALFGRQNYEPMYANSFKQLTVNTGNQGSPEYSHLQGTYFKSHNYLHYHSLQTSVFEFEPYWFARTQKSFFVTPYNSMYYHTNKPYAGLKYLWNGSTQEEEQMLDFVYTQNANRNLNIGINFKLINSIGVYATQKTKNNGLNLFASYFTPQYSFVVSGIRNNFNNYENGGITAEADMSDLPSVIPFSLENAHSSLRNYTFIGVQQLRLGGKTIVEAEPQVTDSLQTDSLETDLYRTDSLRTPPKAPEIIYRPASRLVHRLEFSTYNRIYNDSHPQAGYYPNVYYPDQSLTYDSVHTSLLRNTIEWQLPVDPARRILPLLGIRLLAANEIVATHNFKHYILDYSDTTYSNTFVGAHLFKDKGKYLRFDLSGKMYPIGYRQGDFALKSELKQFFKTGGDSSVLAAAITIKQEKPDYFEQIYYGNHHRWNNDFAPTTTINIEGAFSVPAWNLTIGGGTRTLNNMVYFDQSAALQQYGSPIQTLMAYINKDFHLKYWHFINRVVYQQSTNNDLMHIPLLAANHSTYFEHILFHKELVLQLGVELTYTSKHYAPAYLPDLGCYGLQNEYETGNYPLVDVYMNLKLKKALLFLKMDHVNGYIDDQQYMPVYNYPIPPQMFKFGVFWRFYN